MAKVTAPAKTATQIEDEELPQTAVKPSGKDLLIHNMQNKLAEYMEGEKPPVETTPEEVIDQEEATFKKRYSDLRRHLQQKETGYKREVEELKAQMEQLTKAANQPMPKTKEEFEAWKEKYPDIVGFIEIIADEKASTRAKQLQEELGTVKEKLSLTEKEKAFATLKVMVPDLEELINSSAYKTWFQSQPIFVQEQLRTSDNPDTIAYYIDIFKMGMEKPKPVKKDDKLAALNTAVKNTGVNPGPNSGKWKFTQNQIAKMSTEEYSAKEAEIIEARNSGMILDDTRKNTVFDI